MARIEEDLFIGEFVELARASVQVIHPDRSIMRTVDQERNMAAGYQFNLGEGVIKRVVHKIQNGDRICYPVSDITFYDRTFSKLPITPANHFRAICALEEATLLHYKMKLVGGYD